jgi:hypothetical protein
VWNTDNSGNWLSQGPVVSGFSPTLELLESSFHQDLNGDGVTGLVTTTIESVGATTLSQVGNTFSLYAHGTTSGPQLKFSGAAVSAGQFNSWTPLGAEAMGSGYQLIWKHGSADEYILWNTDSNGNWLSQGDIIAGNSATVKAWEATFNQDFNSNGTVGATAPATTSSDGSNSLVGPMMILSYGPSDENGSDGEGTDHPIAPTMTLSYRPGDEIGGPEGLTGGDLPIAPTMILSYGPIDTTDDGNSGAINVALLTNYLASTFVPPSGEGMGSVAAAQTSDQGFLAKPT